MGTRNTEIKLRLPHERFNAIIGSALLLASHFAKLTQRDTYFGGRKYKGLIKVREETTGDGAKRVELICYQRGTDEDVRLSNYEKITLPDAGILRALALVFGSDTVVVEKTRFLAVIGHTRVHLDTVTGLFDPYLELEVKLPPGWSNTDGQTEAGRILDLLNITADERKVAIRGSYHDLVIAAENPEKK